LEDTRLWQALWRAAAFLVIALPSGIGIGFVDGATVFRRITRPANHDWLAGLAGGHLAHCGWCDLVADVRQPLWSHQSSARSGSLAMECPCWWTIKPELVYPAILVATEVRPRTPFMFLLLLAALANVDKSQLEAASIDGAGYLAHLFSHRASPLFGRSWRLPC
jgi:multiple sugar transport system permease protein